ncbi:VWA domain-containing protein [Paenibacillus sp. CGMCC 1.16610]|uniref:Stress protein n=2 Tax=Paenibacillus TaxID=44249 RepID=A0ABW9UI58_9BACL|nr:VWA domain-containing protein [Paenibacillus sp. CGMCC 1.16610]MVQ38125.1 stress protein [Paenibacillus anseongense]
MLLSKGQKIDVTKGKTLSNISLQFGWLSDSRMSIDASCFILSNNNRCEKDEDFIFYANPNALGGAITHIQVGGVDKEAIKICLSKLPDSATKIAFSLTIHEGEKYGYSMKDVSNMYVKLMDAERNEELFCYEYGSDLLKETAIVVGELYRYNGEWKFNAIGSGFFGGLEALCTNFGLVVEKEDSQEIIKIEEKPVFSSIDLRKKIVQITLEKKKMSHVAARVGLVLDISGSMQPLYKNGTVQEVVERILAVACKFDDNATLDIWIYDNEFSRLNAATERDFDQYVVRNILNNNNIHKFGRNNEPPVMEDVIRKYTIEEDSSIPAFIIFINDGGVLKSIKKVIAEASLKPLFWQFVGIGDSDFEVLKKLDTMEGRIVDNANFIHIKDIASVSDETLYNQLLNEFPLWLKAATDKGIIYK